jgi:hypothetical protein
MAAYFQMGHDTENLVGIEGLEQFSGIILSPVNRPELEFRRYIDEFRTKGSFDIILDPQLYCPRSEHRHLPSHPYFPKDIETAELSSVGWWKKLGSAVANYGKDLDVDAVCSPMILPNRWNPEYYVKCADSYDVVAEALLGSRVRPVMTLCVHLRELGDANDALRIASIVTSRGPAWCYLIVESDLEPRREIPDAENLAALMVLIAGLERSDCRVLVSHASSDMILAKAAGASHCSTGKFFNLRRFTRGRFEETDDGGRQIPYWFEQSLLAFLREADVARLRRDCGPDFLCVGNSNNGFANQILEQFINNPGKAWVALSWRQFLAWFSATEVELADSDALAVVNLWLKQAEERWKEIDDRDVLFQEPRNDGSWIRRWRQAIADFKRTEW